MTTAPPLSNKELAEKIMQIVADRIRAAASDSITISLEDLQAIHAAAYSIYSNELHAD